MNRRVIATIVAAVLALGGLGLIANYVRGADRRALQGVETVAVYVVEAPIAKGTAAEQLGTMVVKKSLAKAMVPDKAVSDLNSISGRVASTDLIKGEVLLDTRFVDVTVLNQQSVTIPPGHQTASFLLRPEQVHGGILQPGDTIGVIFASKVNAQQGTTGTGNTGTPFQVDGTTVTLEGDVMAKMVLQQILVTRVQGAVLANPSADDKKNSNSAPSEGVLVTVAVTAAQAETIAWGVASGAYFLVTLQTKDTDNSSSRTTIGKTAYTK